MSLATAVDTLLDRSIALGYGSVGLAVRRRLPSWPADPPRMDGRVVLVTGAGTGLGRAAAEGYARLGASVRAHGRSDERAAEATEQILRAVPGSDVRPVAFDASDGTAMHAFCDRFTAQEDRLDVLVNNAGVMPGERRHTAAGIELMFATHVLAPWLLTDGLRGLMQATGEARVINITSGGQYGQRVPGTDLESERDDYAPAKFYARTKRAQVIITEGWAERLRGTGVVVHAMHPGWADTKGVQDALATFLKLIRPIVRDAEQGADTIVWMGSAPEVLRSTGELWHDRRIRPKTYALGPGADAPPVRDALWRHCEELAARRSAGPA